VSEPFRCSEPEAGDGRQQTITGVSSHGPRVSIGNNQGPRQSPGPGAGTSGRHDRDLVREDGNFLLPLCRCLHPGLDLPRSLCVGHRKDEGAATVPEAIGGISTNRISRPSRSRFIRWDFWPDTMVIDTRHDLLAATVLFLKSVRQLYGFLTFNAIVPCFLRNPCAYPRLDTVF